MDWKLETVIVDPLGNKYEVNIASMTPQFAHVILLLLQIHDQSYPEHTRRWVRVELSEADRTSQLRKTASSRRSSTKIEAVSEKDQDDTDRRYSIDMDSVPPSEKEED